jgi:hypothetical protein
MLNAPAGRVLLALPPLALAFIRPEPSELVKVAEMSGVEAPPLVPSSAV